MIRGAFLIAFVLHLFILNFSSAQKTDVVTSIKNKIFEIKNFFDASNVDFKGWPCFEEITKKLLTSISNPKLIWLQFSNGILCKFSEDKLLFDMECVKVTMPVSALLSKVNWANCQSQSNSDASAEVNNIKNRLSEHQWEAVYLQFQQGKDGISNGEAVMEVQENFDQNGAGLAKRGAADILLLSLIFLTMSSLFKL